MTNLNRTLDRLGTPRVLVVGDVILDRYTWGDVTRISPEAPVLVLRAQREEVRPGGAASVAALLCALGAEVALAGVIGADGGGRVLQKLLDDDRIQRDALLVDPTRPTTTKERFMGRAEQRQLQQILRVDREETHALDPQREQRLLTAAATADLDALLISDYAKGACTPTLLRSLIDLAAARRIPVCIDPARIGDYARYRSATLLTPNRMEAELATGRKIYTPTDAIAAARELHDRLDVAAVVVKLDRDGMVLASGAASEHFPTQPRSVCDVTGAGDLTLALLGVACASGIRWDDAIPLANLAAGLEVERLGVAPITRAELRAACDSATPSKIVTLDEMAALAAAYRRQGKTLDFTNGCFDLLHVGHAQYLQEAARLGDVLIVAVNSDASVRRLKGPTRPVIGERDRAAMLAALTCVAHVLVFNDDTPHTMLERLRPDVLVKGGTYGVNEIVGREIVESYGGRTCVTAKVGGISTTDLLARIERRALDEANRQ